MNQYHLLILLGSLAILAFIYDIIARKTRIPTVLFLLGTGMILRIVLIRFGIAVPSLHGFLQILGSIGLIFIVFEGALDIQMTKAGRGLMLKAFVSALALLLLTAWAISGLYHFLADAPWHQAWLNAAPLAVISSAIAIPSSQGLDGHRREFVVYESTFSDILGILVFNFILAHEVVNSAALSSLAVDMLWVSLISVAATAFLLYLVAKTQTSNKYTLLFALLVIAYALGKLAHLPTLLLVFVLGICLNNSGILPMPFRKSDSASRRLRHELRLLKRLTGEGSFFLRTYFFVVFGFSISIASLASWRTLLFGGLVLSILILVRGLFLWGLLRRVPVPEVFLAPRGLITILLFFSIPSSQLIPDLGQDVILVVILGSTLLMALGLQWHGFQEGQKARLAYAEVLE